MAKKLQKKLHELESELTDVIGLQLDTAASDPRNRMSFDDVKKRFRFLRHLLDAETASQPQNADQLRSEREKLAELYLRFCSWNESRSTRASRSSHEDLPSICSDSTQERDFPISEAQISKSPVNFAEKEEDFWPKRQISVQLDRIGQRVTGDEADFADSVNGALYNHDDTLSICSDCTQALRYDDVRGSDSPIYDAEDVSGDNSPEDFSDGIGRDDADVKREQAAAAAAEEETILSKIGKYFGVFGCGITVGAIFMVLFSTSPDYFIHYQAFHIPPT